MLERRDVKSLLLTGEHAGVRSDQHSRLNTNIDWDAYLHVHMHMHRSSLKARES